MLGEKLRRGRARVDAASRLSNNATVRASLPTPFVLSRQPDRDGERQRFMFSHRTKHPVTPNCICCDLSRLRAHTGLYVSKCGGRVIISRRSVCPIWRTMISNIVSMTFFSHASWLLLLTGTAATGPRQGLAQLHYPLLWRRSCAARRCHPMKLGEFTLAYLAAGACPGFDALWWSRGATFRIQGKIAADSWSSHTNVVLPLLGNKTNNPAVE